MAPKISVGMPVFNGERYLREAVDSLLSQSFGDFELIISDNASTDGTAVICRELAERDPRIRVMVQRRNRGAAENYNRVFRASRAPFFRWANADDLSGPRLHEVCLRALEENPGAVLAYGGTILVDENGGRLSRYDDNLDLRHRAASRRFVEFFRRVGLTNVIYGLMRRDAMAQGPLMGRGSLPAADTLFMADLSLRGTFVAVPGDHFFRRIHEEASSSDREDQALQADFWTAGRTPFRRPLWSIHQALLGLVASAPIPRVEKLRLFAFVVRRMYWFRSQLLAEIRSS